MEKESISQVKRVKAQMKEPNEALRSALPKVLRETILPGLNYEFDLRGQRWRVSFINTGQMRFTCLWLGPAKKENVTLDVQSGAAQATSTIK